MAFHMERMRKKSSQGGSSNESGTVGENSPQPDLVRFPTKLFMAANSQNDLIRWSDDDRSIIVDDGQFESEVMTVFPGLVQIASFPNFRRQLREYSFNWSINIDSEFEFCHPYFLKGREDILEEVKTKRKSCRRSSNNSRNLPSSPYPKDIPGYQEPRQIPMPITEKRSGSVAETPTTPGLTPNKASDNISTSISISYDSCSPVHLPTQWTYYSTPGGDNENQTFCTAEEVSRCAPQTTFEDYVQMYSHMYNNSCYDYENYEHYPSRWGRPNIPLHYWDGTTIYPQHFDIPPLIM